MAPGDTVAYIKFNISQENSWRFSSSFHDAAWVFVKYSTDDGVTWNHATIVGADMSAATGTALTSSIPDDYKGAFLFRAEEGSGTSSAANVKLLWNIIGDSVNPDPLVTTKVILKVFALEMVHIPQGAFYAGSGGAETSAFYKYPTTTDPYPVVSEDAITVGTTTGNLYYASSTYGGDRGGPIPAEFPKGYKAFYVMKYELTQGKYRDFLNTLERAQQNTRTETDLSSGITSVTNRYVMSNTATIANRNGIRCDATIPSTDRVTFYCDFDGDGVPNESGDGEYIACNRISWADLAAYGDWAGLRPITELEYEKAARGTATSVANEFSWGSINITKTTSNDVAATSGLPNEISTVTGDGLCAYGANTSSASVGPLRAGFAATASTVARGTSGASFYGVMDLTGNVTERAVTVGNSTGRLFTGVHGDGVLDANGDANVILPGSDPETSDWPGTSGSGVGTHAGSANGGGDTSEYRLSDRRNAARTGSTRSLYNGGRLGRNTA
jgi:formylglycine-generating enzyme required for sulfatase activity